MIATFWSGLAGTLADRVAVALFGPATAFWVVGYLAWAGRHPLAGLVIITDSLHGESEPLQVVLVALVVLVLVGSGALAERLAPSALRVMQGDWPRALTQVRRPLVARHARTKESLEEHWEEVFTGLAEHEDADVASAAVPPDGVAALASLQDDLLDTERRLSAYPSTVPRVAATVLGNVMRAPDSRVADKYGLDASCCWPVLWLLVPDIVRSEVGAARKALDVPVVWWIWSVLLLVWLALNPLVVVLAVAAAWVAYRATVTAAVQYGGLIEAAYTVYRELLYDTVHLPRPAPADEVACGRTLTAVIWRGPSLG